MQHRMERGQAYAFFEMAQNYQWGICGLAKDERKAFELWLHAGEHGCAAGNTNVGWVYELGHVEGVGKDLEKSWQYYVVAAKQGCHVARCKLGKLEYYEKGNKALAYNHWRISAEVGCNESMDYIRRGFNEGLVAKDDYERVKGDHQKAKDEMQSDERDTYDFLLIEFT